jgi:hypothetical protein
MDVFKTTPAMFTVACRSDKHQRYSSRRQSKRRHEGPLERITLQMHLRVQLTSRVGPQTGPGRRAGRCDRFKPLAVGTGCAPHISKDLTRVGLTTLSPAPWHAACGTCERMLIFPIQPLGRQYTATGPNPPSCPDLIIRSPTATSRKAIAADI